MASIPSKIPILLLAAAMTLPAAGAWSAYGTSEPDTNLDIPAFMQYKSPGAGDQPGVNDQAHDSVYFNAFTPTCFVLNPNVGALGSRTYSNGCAQQYAMLGQWTDCNNDGYVGLAESAMEEYPSQILDQTGLAMCPSGGPHNKDGWVFELRWIGYDGTADSKGRTNSHFEPNMIVDAAATVWGDQGLPNDFVSGASGFCPVNPQPRGTFATTGGLLDDVDCQPGVHNTYNAIWVGSHRAIAGHSIDTPAVDPSNSLGFQNPSPTSWKGGRADVQLGGSEDSSHSAFSWSCQPGDAPVWAPFAGPADGSDPTTLNGVNDAAYHNAPAHLSGGENERDSKGNANKHPTDLAHAGPRAIVPGVNGAPTSWTVPGTVNATNEAQAGDCNTSNDNGQDVYGAVEGSTAAPAQTLKAEPDYKFRFTAEHRDETPNVQGQIDQDTQDTIRDTLAPTGVLKPNQPQCFGIYILTVEDCPQNLWADDFSTLNTVQPSPARVNVAAGDVTFNGPAFITYYASISPTSGSGPGGSAKYLAAQCPLVGAGVASVHGYDCDPAHWYLDPNDPTGHTHETRYFDGSGRTLAYPGTIYTLRDIDCYDGQIATGVPVYAGTGAVSADCKHQ